MPRHKDHGRRLGELFKAPDRGDPLACVAIYSVGRHAPEQIAAEQHLGVGHADHEIAPRMAFHGADIDTAGAKPDGDRAFGNQVRQRQLRHPLGDLRLERRVGHFAEHARVLRTDPGANIAVRDNDRAGVLEHLVTGDVIGVVVRVHHIADRLWRDLADLAQQGPGRVGLKETVHHQHPIIADDEAGVRPADRRVDPRTDFLQGEGRFRRRWRLGRGRSRHGENQAQQQRYAYLFHHYPLGQIPEFNPSCLHTPEFVRVTARHRQYFGSVSDGNDVPAVLITAHIPDGGNPNDDTAMDLPENIRIEFRKNVLERPANVRLALVGDDPGIFVLGLKEDDLLDGDKPYRTASARRDPAQAAG